MDILRWGGEKKDFGEGGISLQKLLPTKFRLTVALVSGLVPVGESAAWFLAEMSFEVFYSKI